MPLWCHYDVTVMPFWHQSGNCWTTDHSGLQEYILWWQQGHAKKVMDGRKVQHAAALARHWRCVSFNNCRHSGRIRVAYLARQRVFSVLFKETTTRASNASMKNMTSRSREHQWMHRTPNFAWSFWHNMELLFSFAITTRTVTTFAQYRGAVGPAEVSKATEPATGRWSKTSMLSAVQSLSCVWWCSSSGAHAHQ